MSHDRTYRPVPHAPAPCLRDADGSLRQAPRRSAGHAATHPVPPLKGLPGTRATDLSYRALAPGGAGFYRICTGTSESRPTAHYSLLTANSTYTFSAKEKDPETGLSYFGSRYYSSDLSVWLSVDPMSGKYPSLSPYVYCADNPVRLVDPDGEEISTHTDKNGNVLAVYNDGQLGIYVHTQAEIDAFRKGVKFQNDVNQLKGHTLCVSSFSVGDKIDFESFQANRWFNTFKGMFSFAFASPMNAVAYYASEAGNGGLFDPKSKFKNGSQLTEGIYVSPRDLGNYAAGYFGHAVGLSKEFTLASFGAFQLSKNNKVEFLAHFNKYYRQALSTIGIGIEPFQKTYGEAAISNYFQRLGYENINTLDDFNKKYSMIWKD